MSVLYRALARAAKARESAHDSGPAGASGAVAMSRRRGSGRRPLLMLVALVVIVGGTYEFYWAEIAKTLNVIIFGEPPPKPAATARPQAPAPVAASAIASPAPSTTEAVAVPSSGLSAAAASAMVAAPGALTEANSAAVAAASPPNPVPSPSQAQVSPAQPDNPMAATSQPASIAAALPKASASANTSSGKVAAVTAEQNLPEILDRIRQQRTAATLEPSAVVDRAPTAADSSGPSPNAAANMVSVEATAPNERNDTEHAYDLLLHGQYQGALDLYDSVLKSAPDSIAALLGKAIALHKLRRLSDARALYQRVLAIDPNNREALTNVTAIIASQEPSAALAQLRELQRTYPGFSPIPAQIAEIDAEIGNTADAIESFNRAIQLSPDNGLYRLNLAILQDRAGMPQEAAASYQAALDRLGTGAQLPIPIDGIRARLRYLRSR